MPETAMTTINVDEMLPSIPGAELAQEGFAIDAPLIPFDESQSFRAYLIGHGEDVDITDQATGEVQALTTWMFKTTGGSRFTILGASQLNRKLEAVMNHEHFKPAETEVFIVRGGQSETRSGRRVNNYAVHHRHPGS